jgi:hypothetical protein
MPEAVRAVCIKDRAKDLRDRLFKTVTPLNKHARQLGVEILYNFHIAAYGIFMRPRVAYQNS